LNCRALLTAATSAVATNGTDTSDSSQLPAPFVLPANALDPPLELY
jgi:hypothetical protein